MTARDGSSVPNYAYVANNPLKYVDFDGLRFVDITERERHSINRLRMNPNIGAFIRYLDDYEDIELRLNETFEPQGGRWSDVYRATPARGCQPAQPWKGTLNYDVTNAAALAKAHFGLDDTWIDVVLGHELAHWLGWKDGLSPADRDKKSVEWENFVRVPGAPRPSHEPGPGPGP